MQLWSTRRSKRQQVDSSIHDDENVTISSSEIVSSASVNESSQSAPQNSRINTEAVALEAVPSSLQPTSIISQSSPQSILTSSQSVQVNQSALTGFQSTTTILQETSQTSTTQQIQSYNVRMKSEFELLSNNWANWIQNMPPLESLNPAQMTVMDKATLAAKLQGIFKLLFP